VITGSSSNECEMVRDGLSCDFIDSHHALAAGEPDIAVDMVIKPTQETVVVKVKATYGTPGLFHDTDWSNNSTEVRVAVTGS
jgi:hypothetical protein